MKPENMKPMFIFLMCTMCVFNALLFLDIQVLKTMINLKMKNFSIFSLKITNFSKFDQIWLVLRTFGQNSGIIKNGTLHRFFFDEKFIDSTLNSSTFIISEHIVVTFSNQITLFPTNSCFFFKFITFFLVFQKTEVGVNGVLGMHVGLTVLNTDAVNATTPPRLTGACLVWVTASTGLTALGANATSSCPEKTAVTFRTLTEIITPTMTTTITTTDPRSENTPAIFQSRRFFCMPVWPPSWQCFWAQSPFSSVCSTGETSSTAE